MALMTARQPKKTPPANRKGKSFTLWLSEDLKDDLERYVRASRPKTSAKAVMEAALEDFLVAAGFRSRPRTLPGDPSP
jgi:hypothetical protein